MDIEKLLLNEDELDYLKYPKLLDPVYRTITKHDPDDHQPKLYIMDCEMVETEASDMDITRVSLVDKSGNIVIDQLIMPKSPIIDYRTEVTGLSEKSFTSTNTVKSREEIIEFLLDLLYDNDVLAGHHLYGDLYSLGIAHRRIIDTSFLFFHPDGPPTFYSLKALAETHLKRVIQTNIHDSVEDARATLDLIRYFVKQKALKPCWQKIGQLISGPPTLTIIEEAIQIQNPIENILCVYIRGSQAIGTNGCNPSGKPSDWDIVVVVTDQTNVMADQLVRYADLDLMLYTQSQFQERLEDFIIWAHECIYVPHSFILKEQVDFRQAMAEYYKKTPKEHWLPKLRASVGFQSGKKIGSAKRHLQNDLIYACKKHIFIALRFAHYGIDIATHRQIPDVRAHNHYWTRLLDTPDNTFDFDRYHTIFKQVYEQFRVAAPKLVRHGGFRGGKHLSRFPQSVSAGNAGDDQTPLVTREELTQKGLTYALQSRFGGDLRQAQDWLFREYRIKSQIHQIHLESPNKLVQFRYTEFSPKSPDPFVDKMAGIIFEVNTSTGEWRIVAYPFDRIANFTKATAVNLDLKSLRWQEKIDGSLAIMYYYDDQWQVASSRVPDGSNFLGEAKTTIRFRDLFWEIFHESGYSLEDADPNYTYMFELTSPEHVIIIRYPTGKLRLIGARSTKTAHGEEQELYLQQVAETPGWDYVKSHPLNLQNTTELEQYVESVKQQWDGSKQEGVILCDKNFIRIKVKAITYIKTAWLFPQSTSETKALQFSPTKFVIIIQRGKQDEFKLYCPEYSEEIDALEDKYWKLVTNILEQYDEVVAVVGLPPVGNESFYSDRSRKYRREFAKAVLKIKDSMIKHGVLALNKGIPIEDYIGETRAKILLNYFNTC